MASKMAHFYPDIQWWNLTFKQLNGYLMRIPDLYQKPMSEIERAQDRDMKQYRIENNI